MILSKAKNLITVLGKLAEGNDQRCLASLSMTRGLHTVVILSGAKNLRSFLRSAIGGHRTLAAVPNRHSDRAIVDSFVR